jgi:hypothetical protein
MYQIQQFDGSHLNQPCRRVEYRRNKQSAMENAQGWATRPGLWASIVHRGKVIMRYWRDADGLQFLEY